MKQSLKIYVAGHQGLVGRSLMRRLAAEDRAELIVRTRQELDLRDQAATEAFFQAEKPNQVFLAAAKVGGIVANNDYPADFIRDNLQIQTNVIDSAFRHGCRKFLFLGSSCIYPKNCPQPMKEEYLLSGPLEPTNQPFALAKLAGLSMGLAYRRQFGFDFIAALPGNLYGPGDNFHPEGSHVLPALMRRFHEAALAGDRRVTIWGTGVPQREFLHVDDLADALIFLMQRYSGDGPVNVGSGYELSMLELARKIAAVVGFKGQIDTDPSRPDGTPRKLLDSSLIRNLGWSPSVDFDRGLTETYRWYADQASQGLVRGLGEAS